MDERFTQRPVARWYTAVAVVSFLLMAAAAAIYATHHLLVDLSRLPLDQRQALEAEPRWVSIAAAMGVLTGLAGTVMLVLKRKPAEPVLLLSLIATLIWLAGLFATPLLRQSMSTNDAAVALATVLISWTIYWFARHSRQRGWLR